MNMKKCILLLCLVSMLSACGDKQQKRTLVILSTTDTHSQVEPLPAKSTKYADMGGYARRMELIAQQRAENPDLLLFDSGDFSQGTPYFNFYHGRIEVDAMNRMGYDAATLGNHEFDNGLDTLAMLLRLAKFPIVCANYDVSGTVLEGLVKPYIVIDKGGIRTGVFGLGVSPQDLIAKKNFGDIRFLDPLTCINKTASLLREKEKCDVVVCLSHIGSDGKGVVGHEDERDLTLIPMTQGVDLFLSGHTHHFYEGERLSNAQGEETVLLQAGKSGVKVGKITIELEPSNI